MKYLPARRVRGDHTISFELLPLSSIRENSNNAREHDRNQLAKLARSIEKFGFNIPIVVDEGNELLCGHARLIVARRLGLQTIPAIRASHLSEQQKRAFIIADNRLPELANWDMKLLKRELQFLCDIDIDFDFAAIGFDTPEVDFILEDDHGSDDRADAIPQVSDLAAVSKLGDLWQLGEHRLYCGSALENPSYRQLLANDRAQMVFTDPPYNVPIHGHVGGRGLVKHREFAMASGEMTDAQFIEFLSASLTQIQKSVEDGAICFVCMDWRHTQQLMTAAETFTLKNICVWVKNNAGMGSLYRSQHEFIFVLKCGSANHINNVELGKHGRNRSNVWEYRGINSFGRNRDDLLKSHPTVKPVALVADAIKDCSKRGCLILDPFGGSGTTLIAAEKTKRRAALIEIDPLYVDTTIRRWQAYTGGVAVLAGSRTTFPDCEQAIGLLADTGPFTEGDSNGSR